MLFTWELMQTNGLEFDFFFDVQTSNHTVVMQMPYALGHDPIGKYLLGCP